MRYLFIGLFVIAFLAGVVAMGVNRSPDGRPGFLGDIFKAIGITQREEQSKRQALDLMSGNKGSMAQVRELMESMRQSQAGLMENIKDQQKFLEDTNTQMTNLSDMVRNLTERNNVDLLHLKETMENFNNQNRLLIENGKNLIKFNQDQLKIRQQSLDDMSLSTLESNLNQGRFKQNVNESLRQRADFINHSADNVQALRERTEQLQDQLRNLENNLTKKEDEQLITHLKDMQAKSTDILANVKLNEQRLRDEQQQHENQAKVSKEHVDEFIQHNVQYFKDTQEQLHDQKRNQDERIQDQMQRLRDQRTH